ncbi:MAG: FAD/NAD(P)-binding protein [Candidatus Methanomethylicia archaeon]
MIYEEYVLKRGLINKIIQETHDIYTYHITPIEGEVKGAPGQFNIIYIYGGGEIPISISGIEDGSIMHTVRFVGAVTRMLSRIKEKSIIGLRGPYGNTWPVKEAEGFDILIVSGGIGIAPLRPVIMEVERNRDRYGRMIILYGARTPRDLVYRREFERYKRIRNTEFHVTVDRGEEEWAGAVGVVTTLIPKVDVDPKNTIAMVCGPEIMMKFTVKDLIKKKIPEERIYISMERRMRCGIGQCGHCQVGPYFVCKDGPVFQFSKIKGYFEVEQI